ncbi:PilZ domain-containing protein [Aliamphritea ceti]|uniref:PilZ domain-containing protein n=1 Tax=Aliamphritea ceti TaxID=1524258 RepID=UPI0021C32D9C|nr:PilZ domain-containing protein [Aliamphritea ceti]
MKLTNNDSLEIEQVVEDAESDAVSRKAYRLPLRDKDNYFLEMNGSAYPLLDISVEGACIAILDTPPISADGTKAECKVVLGDQVFEGLQGQVVHTSLDFDGGWICGIHWTDTDELISQSLQQALLALRKEMFENA